MHHSMHVLDAPGREPGYLAPMYM